MMRSICLFLLFLCIGLSVAAQSKTSVKAKPIIDTGMLRTWPLLSYSDEKPVISPDGNYVAFVIYNLPLKRQTFVIKSTVNDWKREMVRGVNYDFYFSRDNKRLYWNNSDSLFSLSVPAGEISLVANIKSVKTPRFSKGEWIAYELNTPANEVIILNLLSGKMIHVTNALDYFFNDYGTSLFVRSLDTENNLNRIELSTGNSKVIWTASGEDKFMGFSFDIDGNQLAFNIQSNKNDSTVNTIWYYRNGMEKAVKIVNNSIDSLVLAGAPPLFSRNGKYLFFSMKQPEINSVKEPDAVKVEIWSFKDKDIYPKQSPSKKLLQGIVNVSNGEIRYIQKDDQILMSASSVVSGDYIVFLTEYDSGPMGKSQKDAYWLFSLNDGSKRLIREKNEYDLLNLAFSPKGKWLIYWSSELNAYISYDVESGKTYNITRFIPPVNYENITGVFSNPESNVAGWYANDSALLLYDRYDIWRIDPSNLKRPVNITGGYGNSNHVKLRLLDEYSINGKSLVFTGAEEVMLYGLNPLNKHNGFFMKKMGDNLPPRLLTMGPYIYYLSISQLPPWNSAIGQGMKPVTNENGRSCWIVRRCSATEFPNYFFTRDFKEFRPLTDLQPQRKYNWLTAKLIEWKQTDGVMNRGVLYYPENFDPGKKYPVIFNYYEKMSDQLFAFIRPGLTEGGINVPWFVSRGYLVFTPDVLYSVASSKNGKLTGESAVNAVVSAALYLSTLPYVDKKKMGLEGHSFGGGQTNYIITHSNLFAAACAAASTVSDQVSAYLGIKYRKGKPISEFRMEHSETGHDMIGTTLWERPDLYIKASPVFNANKVTTPVLLMHNRGDDVTDWGQSIELYMALRRLGKRSWLLQYDESGHTADGKDGLDFTIRLTQFFDHYLKNAPPPQWMTLSSLAKYKGVKKLYQLDSEGYCGKDCEVCKSLKKN